MMILNTQMPWNTGRDRWRERKNESGFAGRGFLSVHSLRLDLALLMVVE